MSSLIGYPSFIKKPLPARKKLSPNFHSVSFRIPKTFFGEEFFPEGYVAETLDVQGFLQNLPLIKQPFPAYLPHCAWYP
jgi:hypothetical protein